MARTGRKRKPANRYPCGQIRHPRTPDEPFRLEGIEQRVVRDERNREVTRYENLWISTLSKLYCEQQIEDEQHDAGGKFYELWNEWRRICGAPSPHAKVFNPEASGGRSLEVETDADCERAERLRRRYRDALTALVQLDPSGVVGRIVIDVCIDDREVANITKLKFGLNALAKHFGLDN